MAGTDERDAPRLPGWPGRHDEEFIGLCAELARRARASDPAFGRPVEPRNRGQRFLDVILEHRHKEHVNRDPGGL